MGPEKSAAWAFSELANSGSRVKQRAMPAAVTPRSATAPQRLRLVRKVAPRNSTQATKPRMHSGTIQGKNPVRAETVSFTVSSLVGPALPDDYLVQFRNRSGGIRH